MQFHVPSSEVHDSPSQRKDIDLILERSKISSAEKEIFHQRTPRAFQCIPVTLFSTQEGRNKVSCSWIGKNQKFSATEVQRNIGFIFSEGLSEHSSMDMDTESSGPEGYRDVRCVSHLGLQLQLSPFLTCDAFT